MGLSGPQPPMFGRLVAPKDVAMIAYAQLEVLGFLPSLQVGAGSGRKGRRGAWCVVPCQAATAGWQSGYEHQ
jgi:hypothetical protein